MFCAAEWVVGVEKNPDAPLICAALSQPELEVNELKVDSLESDETVMPGIDDAELDNEPRVKLKFAKVAACADVKPSMHARHSLLRGGWIMGVKRGVVSETRELIDNLYFWQLEIMLEQGIFS